ncbi:MAG: metal-sensing transcriptional repressor [Clostridiales bacterium]|nr:metal-sensing transcriptional repressor [Candidatus Apopatocola equi]MCQ2439223.1 metal-sensing transcriptional repressor [Oscillospiraceae bacterium]
MSDSPEHTHVHADGSVHTHSHGNGPHQHIHSDSEKKSVISRLNRIIGHLEAIKRMVEGDEDCSQVLTQLAAVRSALNGAGRLVLRNHIDHCIVEAVEENDTASVAALNDAIDKFLK